MEKQITKILSAISLILLTQFLFVIDTHAYQNVKVSGRQLLEDFDHDGVYKPYLVKGVGYAPYPIGTFPSEYGLCRYNPGGNPQFSCGGNLYDNSALFNRDFPYIKAMNANTIRTWDKITLSLLNSANQYGLKVIAGYWIPTNLDYVNTNFDTIKNDFKSYVSQFKDNQAILAWGLSNENHLYFCTFPGATSSCDKDAQARAFYKLVNDMAQKVKVELGADVQPILIVSADLGDIGNANRSANDSSLSSIDIHGVNGYRGSTFGSLFSDYMTRSAKPLLITEFGTDAWYTNDPSNPSNGQLREDLQASYVASAWDDIVNHNVIKNGPDIGGVVFDYADGWWKFNGAWSPTCLTHDYGIALSRDGLPFNGGQPDGYVNEEWFGIMSVTKNSDPSIPDSVTPRQQVYTALQQKFGPDLVVTSVSGPGTLFPYDLGIVTVGIKNQGLGDISGNIPLWIYLSTDSTITTSDTRVRICNFVGLNAGASSTQSCLIQIPGSLPLGSYYWGAIVDPTNTYLESNEANNNLAGNLITVIPRPDLTMTYLNGPMTAIRGSAISVSNTVNNLTSTTAGAFTIGIYLSLDSNITTGDILVGTRSVSSLPGGVSFGTITTANIPSTLTPGTYYLGAIADYTNVIAEQNETNNSRAANTVVIQ